MIDLSSVLSPTLFKGGVSADYVLEVLANGGVGTRHIATKMVVPHVLAKVPGEELAKALQGGGGQLQPMMSVANAAGQAMQVGLAYANLGVGLLNLGVSAWTAWKVHKMDKKLDRLASTVDRVESKIDGMSDFLAASTAHLDSLIRENSMMLGMMIEHQGRLVRDDVAVIRQEMAQGFRGLEHAISSAEARREAQELERQMRSLFRYYSLCSREMQEGRPPPLADLRRIIDGASDCIAWLDARLSPLAAGRAERLPLLVARVFALRLETEARGQLDEAADTRRNELRQVSAVIRGELAALTQDTSVYELADARQEMVEQYVFLFRSITAEPTMIELSDGQVIPYYPQHQVVWDDGLQRVRDLAGCRTEEVGPAFIPLETLEEHKAWQKLAGLPRGSTNEEVDRADVVRALGLPKDANVPHEEMRELMVLGGSALADARARISKAVA